MELNWNNAVKSTLEEYPSHITRQCHSLKQEKSMWLLIEWPKKSKYLYHVSFVLVECGAIELNANAINEIKFHAFKVSTSSFILVISDTCLKYWINMKRKKLSSTKVNYALFSASSQYCEPEWLFSTRKAVDNQSNTVFFYVFCLFWGRKIHSYIRKGKEKQYTCCIHSSISAEIPEYYSFVS